MPELTMSTGQPHPTPNSIKSDAHKRVREQWRMAPMSDAISTACAETAELTTRSIHTVSPHLGALGREMAIKSNLKLTGGERTWDDSPVTSIPHTAYCSPLTAVHGADWCVAYSRPPVKDNWSSIYQRLLVLLLIDNAYSRLFDCRRQGVRRSNGATLPAMLKRCNVFPLSEPCRAAWLWNERLFYFLSQAPLCIDIPVGGGPGSEKA